MNLKEMESKTLEELDSLLWRFGKFESPIRKILLRKYPPERVAEAEGKKCIISIRGLRYHERVYFFQINELSVKEIGPFDQFDTWMECSANTVAKVLKGALAGREGTLSEALSDDSTRVRGKATYHDMVAFSEIFDEIARNIKKLRRII